MLLVNLHGLDAQSLELLMSGKRLRGTLGYSADGTLNFHAWREKPHVPYTFIRLRHGRASVSPQRVRLYFDMARAEKIDPVSAIYNDMYDAVSFVREEVKPQINNDDEQNRPA